MAETESYECSQCGHIIKGVPPYFDDIWPLCKECVRDDEQEERDE